MKKILKFIISIIGKVYLLLTNNKIDLEKLQHSLQRNSLSRWDKFILLLQKEGMKWEYYKSSTPTKRREEIKSYIMGGNAGAEWAKNYAKDFNLERNLQIRPFFSWIQQLLSEQKIKTVHQVGCSSGRELAYLATQYPEVKCKGSDCCKEAIEFCHTHWQQTNMNFCVVDLTEKTNVEHIQSDLIFCSGVLPYLDPNSMQQFFKLVRAKYLALGEPLEKQTTKSSLPMHSDFKWEHPYAYYLKKQGWNIIQSEVTQIDKCAHDKTRVGKWINIIAQRD